MHWKPNPTIPSIPATHLTTNKTPLFKFAYLLRVLERLGPQRRQAPADCRPVDPLHLHLGLAHRAMPVAVPVTVAMTMVVSVSVSMPMVVVMPLAPRV